MPPPPPYNLTYQRVEIPSDTLVLSIELLAYTTAALTLVLYALSAWVIVARSPRMMGPYRWYLLFHSTIATAMELLTVLILPVPLMPYPMAVYGGSLLRVWAPVSPYIVYGIRTSWSASIVAMSCAMVTLFVYRYSLLTGNWIYRRVLQNVPLTFALNLLVPGVVAFVFLAPDTFYLSSVGERRAQLLEAVRSVDGAIYEKIKDQNVFEYFVGRLSRDQSN